MLLFLSMSVSSLMALSFALPSYQERIPNGNNVPNPCNVSELWHGVEHENPVGGGTLNKFGQKFREEGYTWTTALCEEDSDEDGKTNGDELGDPKCSWTPGTNPVRTVNITHPGICDTCNSEMCKNKTSDSIEICDVNKPGVLQLNLTFPVIPIPSTVTNYLCMTFDLPSDKDYHIIANEAIINNSSVVHHMLLFGCREPRDVNISHPETCNMNTQKLCNFIINGWTFGQPLTCFSNNTGYRIGHTAFKRVLLQIHYNNPALVQNYTDSSGMRLYYQPVRAGFYDLKTFTTGQQILEIPPGPDDVEQVGVCPSSCTKYMMKKPAYVTSALNHMHRLGKSMNVEVFRGGESIKNLSYDSDFKYDTPRFHIHNPPFELRPGDEIKTTCVYKSHNDSRTVTYGEGTSDEMCFAFIILYPEDAFSSDYCVEPWTSQCSDITITTAIPVTSVTSGNATPRTEGVSLSLLLLATIYITFI